MNIFALHSNPAIAAEYHCDTHTVKMILEYAQLLSTAHRVLDGDKDGKLPSEVLDSGLYKRTHVNHPSAIWVRQSSGNYQWLHNLLGALLDEYHLRYKKHHSVSSELYYFLETMPLNIPKGEMTGLPTPAMPDEYKIPGDVVMSYRNYYYRAKTKLLTYTNRDIPVWLYNFAFANGKNSSTTIKRTFNIED